MNKFSDCDQEVNYMMSDLNKKDVNIENVAKIALGDEKLLTELINGLTAKKETFRYNCSKTIALLSEEHPDVIYPRWDDFVKLLGSDNTYHKISAIIILANLMGAGADTENKFKSIFDEYFNLLNDKSMITAAYIARNSWKIVKAKPKLQTKVTNRLLDIDNTHHNPERKDLIKGYAIESFEKYIEDVKDRMKIMDFVKKQLESKSPRTRKAAKKLMKKTSKEK
jgi:hypothetical protein